MKSVHDKIKRVNESRISTITNSFSDKEQQTKSRMFFTVKGINDYVQKAMEVGDTDDALFLVRSLVPYRLKTDTVYVASDTTEDFLKGGPSAQIGEIRTFGGAGKQYIKTNNGWRPVPKKNKQAAAEHEAHTAHSGTNGKGEGRMPGYTEGQGTPGQKTTQSYTPKKTTSVEREKNEASANEPGRQKVSVSDRWKTYETFTDMVIEGDAKSLIAYGGGGIGKTYMVEQHLKAAGLQPFDESKHVPAGTANLGKDDEEDDSDDEGDNQKEWNVSGGKKATEAGEGSNYDYVKITGRSTITQMWKSMYEHNGKLIVFDDCDSIFDDPSAVNILKGALDSSGDGTIQYKEFKDQESGEWLPKRFKFTGRMIFITNKPSEDFSNADLQPLKSRSLVSDLTMNKEETLQRTRDIAPKMDIKDAHGNVMKDVTLEEKNKAIKFIEDHKDEIGLSNFNTRTISNIVKLIRRTRQDKGLNWKNVAAQQLGLTNFKQNAG